MTSFLLRATVDEDEIKAQMQVLDISDKLLSGRVIGIEYVIVKLLKNIFNIKSAFNDFDKSILLETLEVNIASRLRDYMFTKEFNMKEALIQQDLSLNPNDPKENKDIENHFFACIMEVIENAMSTTTSVTEAIMAIDSLKAELIANAYQLKLYETSSLYATKNLALAIEKDKILQEGIDELKFISTLSEEDQTGSNGYVISSYDDSIKVRAMNGASKSKDLFTITDAGPLADKFKIKSDDIIVMIAEINVGKTRFCYDTIYRCLTSGVNVTFVSTEEPKEKIQSKLEKAHLFTMFKYKDYPEREILNIENIEDKSLRRQYELLEEKMELARRDLWGNKAYGKLHQIDNFCYEDSREFFRAEKRIYGSDIVFVDHIRALKSNGRPIYGRPLGTQKEQLSYLMQAVRLSKVEDNLGFMLFSHPSTDAESSFKSNKQTLSANLSASAREVSEAATRIFFLTSKLHLEQNDQVYITEAKSREEGKIRTPQVLARQGASNIHLWLEQNQEEALSDSIEGITDI